MQHITFGVRFQLLKAYLPPGKEIFIDFDYATELFPSGGFVMRARHKSSVRRPSVMKVSVVQQAFSPMGRCNNFYTCNNVSC